MLSGDVGIVLQNADDHQRVRGLSPAPRRQQRSAQRGKRQCARSMPVGRRIEGGVSGPPPESPPFSEVIDRRVPRPLRDVAALPDKPNFRFWIDEVLWSQGRVAVELVDQVLAETGGVRTGGPGRSEARALKRQLQGSGPLGSQHMAAWELLWTKSTYAIPAARAMRAGQLVSAIIGLNSLTMKKRLMLTLREAYGPEGAFAITPRTFALPEEQQEWERWVAAAGSSVRTSEGGRASETAASGGDHGGVRGGCGAGEALWILKTGQDAGKGLSLLPASQAILYSRAQQQQPVPVPEDPDESANSRRTGGSGGAGAGKHHFPLQVAQLYVADPFLILGRKFHLRLWVLVTGHRPLRAYLHRRGLVLFSAEDYSKEVPWSASTTSTGTSGGSATMRQHDLPASHITNYARNANTLVWSLSQLASHLGPKVFAALWTRLCAACCRAVAAARDPLERAHTWLQPAVPEYGFQMMGVDFLLDARLTPWLLEFNSAPSVMVQHEVDEIRQLVYEQKYGMLRDTWAMVRGRVYREAKGRGGDSPARRPGGGGRSERECRDLEAAAVRATEYEPLMPYMTV